MRAMFVLIAAFAAPASAAVAPSPAPTVFYSNPAHSTRQGEYTLHHLAQPTLALSPDTARSSGVTRSANRALLNLSLHRGTAANSIAVAAPIRATARNTVGQVQTLNLREVREREALYYLAEARIEPRDTLFFEVVVELPDGRPLRASFSQEFWPEEPRR